MLKFGKYKFEMHLLMFKLYTCYMMLISISLIPLTNIKLARNLRNTLVNSTFSLGGGLLRTNAQSESSIDPVWANIWSLRVLAKVKKISWRLLHGTLACKGLLANRHIITSSLCPICAVHCEDTLHDFFKCPE
jgi:hypothetical protein